MLPAALFPPLEAAKPLELKRKCQALSALGSLGGPGPVPSRSRGTSGRQCNSGTHSPSVVGTDHQHESPLPQAHSRLSAHLLNSGSFSRSSRAEWQVTRLRSNCAMSSSKVLPIWFSAREGSPAAQLLPPLSTPREAQPAHSGLWAPHSVFTTGFHV